MTRQTYTAKWVGTYVQQVSFVADHQEHAEQIMNDYVTDELDYHDGALQVQCVDSGEGREQQTAMVLEVVQEPDDYLPPCERSLEKYAEWKENIPYYQNYKTPKGDS